MTDRKRGVFDKKKKNVIRPSQWSWIRSFVIGEVKPLLLEIKNHKKGNKTRKALLNYLIIRTVTVFELYHINRAYYLAKIRRGRARKLFTDIKTSGTLAEQVISSFSYTNPKDIQQVFSILLDFDYFSEIKKESEKYASYYSLEYEHIPYTTPLHKNWKNVMNIFEIRHDIVHHNKIQDLPYSEIRNLVGGLMQFLLCSILIKPLR